MFGGQGVALRRALPTLRLHGYGFDEGLKHWGLIELPWLRRENRVLRPSWGKGGGGRDLTHCPDGNSLPPLQPVSTHYSHLTDPGILSRSGHSDARLLTGGTICQAGRARQDCVG